MNEIQQALLDAMAAADIIVHDRRDDLPRHKTKCWETVPMDRRRGFCFHHAGADGTIENAAQYHVAVRRWPGLAYSLAICNAGSLTIANNLDVRTYSQGDANKQGDENARWIGVLVNGFFRSPGFGPADGAREPTVEQIRTVVELIRFGQMNGLGDTTGHYMFGKPACPGTTIESIIRAARFHAFNFDLDTAAGRQAALAALGYYVGAIDGIWGFQSRAALAEFQRDAGIMIDGIWGPESRAAVVRYLNK